MSETFQAMVLDLLGDLDKNKRTNSMNDDLWDESIKVKTANNRKSMQPMLA